MKKLKIARVIKTEDEFFNSPEWNDMWDGWQGKSMKERVMRGSDFIAGYVVETDPEKNYGRSYDLYRHYETGGLKILKKCEIHSSLTNAPLQIVDFVNQELIIFTDSFYKNDNVIRERIKLKGLTVY